ncbi:HSF-type DNA-binding-domain-containing protein [Epithele typhae]|uniref:HSF-type DNA-binding-domain-containing protein n=1 Tax=Epithele typhae TaxID=378194 RepID=UPI0020081FCD|nr:HSF-type DNA-binding-domain-containing protein [Epithele typhae]KAH9939093.1 HSF-type DNA-binding-domain-containing protein [Epithele typhae]
MAKGEGVISDSLGDRPDKTALSLNISSLSVTSPTNLSPINPSPHPSTHASSHVSPITPISPSANSLIAHGHHPHAHHPHIQQPFQFAPPDHGVRYDDGHYDSYGKRLTSSRSSSCSDKSVPRKRSYQSLAPLTTNVEEGYHMGENPQSALYDEVDMSYPMDAEGSPIDGSNSGGEQDDKPMDGQVSTSGSSIHHGSGPPPSLGVLNKPLGTNNFVTKLYQMINDPKSSQFINWTELGTSFVVSNVGEFSRTILGSHFKHNNFSSFVRQLNMYGFHKINRTPRAQRTSADVQTWEFSHHKFLRGRPDLLEEIKRKALEPDPSLKHRVELPGEVAAQLSSMRDDNHRLMVAFQQERQKVDRLVSVTKAMYDVMVKTCGKRSLISSAVPTPFPSDILDSTESPNIYVTSPQSAAPPTSHFQTMSSLPPGGLHSLHSMSPGSSPTASEFPSHAHSSHTLSRQHSYQHMPYDTMHHPHHSHHSPHHSLHGMSAARFDSAMSTPLPPSPGGMDYDERVSAKRQRTNPSGSLSLSHSVDPNAKKSSRARSDSAPLGYGLSSWPQTRPRSGSGLAPRGLTGSVGASGLSAGAALNGRREEVPNIGSLSRGQLPMLSIPSMKQSS